MTAIDYNQMIAIEDLATEISYIDFLLAKTRQMIAIVDTDITTQATIHAELAHELINQKTNSYREYLIGHRMISAQHRYLNELNKQVLQLIRKGKRQRKKLTKLIKAANGKNVEQLNESYLTNGIYSNIINIGIT